MSEKRYLACTTGVIALFVGVSRRLPYSRTGAHSGQGHVMRISEAECCTYDRIATGDHYIIQAHGWPSGRRSREYCGEESDENASGEIRKN